MPRRSESRRSLRPAVLAGLLACASPGARAPDHTPEAAVAQLLADRPDERAVSEFTGLVGPRCLASASETDLCEWRVDREGAGWEPLARAIGSQDALALICELPRSGEPRARDSCTAHPRRSNRGAWELPGHGSGKSAPDFAARRAEVAERYRQTADRLVAHADTLARLSRLMGALPDACSPLSSGEQLCVWRTTSHTQGHGTLMAWIGALKRQKIRLGCRLPTDGSPRAPGSCQAQVGS
jgi:hypothetical protein